MKTETSPGGSYWLRSRSEDSGEEANGDTASQSLALTAGPPAHNVRKRKRGEDSTSSRASPQPKKRARGNQGGEKSTTTTNMQYTSMKPVRVLPQELLERTTHRTPEEPSEPPPPTTDLVSILVVGDDNVGKSSLVKSFVSHESLASSMKDDGNNNDDDSKATGRGARNKSQAWSVAYEKKKFSFWNKHNSLRSLFVQILEVSGLNPIHHSTIGIMGHVSEWNKLWNKAAIVLLVVNISESPEIIPKKIQTWKHFLDAQNDGTAKPVVLMLHQGDKLMQHQCHPTFWIEFGKQMSDMCHKLNIQSWHVTSSCLEDDDLGGSIDKALVEILGDKGRPASWATSTTASLSTGTPLVAHPDTSTPDKKGSKKQSRVVSPLT